MFRSLCKSFSKNEHTSRHAKYFERMFHTIRVEEFPFVQVHLQRNPNSTQEIAAFKRDFINLLALAARGSTRVAKTPLFLCMNIDGLVSADAEYIVEAVGIVKDVSPLVEEGAIAATALVASSEYARSLLNDIFTFVTLKSKNQIFDTMDAARAWLTSQM